MDEELEAVIEVRQEGADKAEKEIVGALDGVQKAGEEAAKTLDKSLDLSKIVNKVKAQRKQLVAEFEKAGEVLKEMDLPDKGQLLENQRGQALDKFDSNIVANIRKAQKDIAAEEAAATREFEKNQAQRIKAAAQTANSRVADNMRALTVISAREDKNDAEIEKMLAGQQRRLKEIENARVASAARASNAVQAEATKEARFAAKVHQDRVKMVEEAYAENERFNQARIRQEQAYIDSLSNTRYALYDVARTYTMIATAAAAVVGGPVAVAASYENAFASAARTAQVAGNEAEALQDQLIKMTTEMPVAFGDIASIATLAGQLDIAKENIADFTQVVAQFAATTNVSVDEAAKNIGRVAQLTGTPGTEYENLASAIYQVGVTSVATESEILSMMSSISTAGDLAGFSNKEIVALSGALASLGVQPEAARGSLQRIFNTITVGAETGGESLEKLAEVSGLTMDQISNLWKTDSQQVFTAFVQGLDNMAAGGQNTTEVLKDLGINAVRDQRALQVLANNMGVYTQALTESDQAYASASALQEGYAKQTDTVVGSLEKLKNTVTAVLDSIGSAGSGPLKTMLDLFLKMADGILSFVNTPIGQVFSGLALTLGAVVAVMTAKVAIAARVRAAMYGMMTAADGMSRVNGTATNSVTKLSGQLARLAIAFTKGKLDATEFARVTGIVATKAEGAAAALNQQTAAAANASTRLSMAEKARAASTTLATKATNAGAAAVRGLGAAIRIVPQMAAMSAALAVVTKGVELFTEARKSAGEKAADFLGDTSGYREALQKDLKIYQETGKAHSTFTAGVKTNVTSVKPWVSALGAAADAQVTLKDSMKETTESTKEQTFAIGENVEAMTRKLVADTEEIQRAFSESRPELEALGFDFTKYFDLVATDTEKAKKYVSDFKDAYYEAFTGGPDGMSEEEWTRQSANLLNSLGDLEKGAISVGDAVKDQATKVDILNLAFANASQEAKDASGLWNEGADDIDAAGSKIDEFKNRLLGLSDSTGSITAVQGSLAKLFDSVVKNGGVWDAFSEEGRSNLGALESAYTSMVNSFGHDTDLLGTNIVGLMGSLVLSGEATTESMGYLQAALWETLGSGWTLDFDPSKGLAGIFATIDAAAEAQKALLNLGALQEQLAAGPRNMGTAGSLGEYEAQRMVNLQNEYNRAAQQAAAIDKQAADAKKLVRQNLEQYNSAVDRAREATDKSTKSQKDNTKAAEEAVVTWEDYANTIKKIVDRMDNLIFGLRDAKQAVKDAIQEIDKATGKVTEASDAVWNFDKVVQNFTRNQERLDDVQSVYLRYKEQADAARIAVQKANTTISGLQNERTNLQYGLAVAIEYGDEARAAAIRQRIAEIDGEIVDLRQQQSAEQDKLNRSLDPKDMSAAAIENRNTVRSMMGTFTSYLKALDDAGTGTKKMNKAVNTSKEEFKAWGVAMGFSEAELAPYIALFDDFAKETDKTTKKTNADNLTQAEKLKLMDDLYDSHKGVIDQMIRQGASQDEVTKYTNKARREAKQYANQLELGEKATKKYTDGYKGLAKYLDEVSNRVVTVKFDGDPDPATAALKEWREVELAAQKKNDIKISADTSGLKGIGKKISSQLPKSAKVRIDIETNSKSVTKTLAALRATRDSYIAKQKQGNLSQTMDSYYYQRIMDLTKQIRGLGGKKVGGFTGRGNANEASHIAHRGEFIFPKYAVNQSTGLPYMMERAAAPTLPNIIMVELSPEDRKLIAQGQQSIVVMDGKAVGRVVDASNVNSARRGSQ